MKTLLYFTGEEFLFEMAKSCLEPLDVQVIGPNKDLDNISLVQNVTPDLILIDVDDYPELPKEIKNQKLILSGKKESLFNYVSDQKLIKPLKIKDFKSLILL